MMASRALIRVGRFLLYVFGLGISHILALQDAADMSIRRGALALPLVFQAQVARL
jgi:hypothetical protein